MTAFLNLGCGPVFVASPEWVNLDFEARYPWVQGHDLLKPLPFKSCSFDLVYSSHFLEHVPREYVSSFLQECKRVLRPGGVIRLVLPDADEMFRTYLHLREQGLHDKADFVILEIIDQCVRSKPGGLLADFYRQILASYGPGHSEWMAFVQERNGEDFGYALLADDRHRAKPLLEGMRQASLSRLRLLLKKIRRRILSHKHRLGLRLLDPAFKRQNVSFAGIGERHQWLWDFYSLSNELERLGFNKPLKKDPSLSIFPDFPFFPLDLTSTGSPRKGAESMYVEAEKPST